MIDFSESDKIVMFPGGPRKSTDPPEETTNDVAGDADKLFIVENTRKQLREALFLYDKNGFLK